jgi:asparagine synthase (glutamine-hydrolysing)
MCGIAFLISASASPEALAARLATMNRALQHRGPDGSGTLIEQARGGLRLGATHRRLSILDVSRAADQPMLSACGRYWLCYNGELYNYRELAEELAGDTDLARSTGDTVVLLAALKRWGEEALWRLNGMFAFGFYDRHTQRLLLARDRAGEKPLHLMPTADGLAIASEIGALLALEPGRLALNRTAVAHYLTQSISNFDQRTLFGDIEELPPASALTLTLSASTLVRAAPRAVWLHPYQRGEPADEMPAPEAAAAHLRGLLDDAVRIRLRSDVPVGILLSGGLDSTGIAALAARHVPADQLVALGAISSASASSEAGYIRQAAAHLRCRLHLVDLNLRPETVLARIPQVVQQNEQPLSSLSVVAHALLMERARELGLTVLFSGQGADEQLGGYHKFLVFYLQHALRHGRLDRALAMLIGSGLHGTFRVELSAAEARRFVPRLRGSAERIAGAALQDVPPLALGLGAGYAEREWRDLAQTSLPMILHYEDRMSMQQSREIRLPFLDVRIVEWLARVAPHYKLRGGWSKWVLRRALAPLIPAAIAWRPDKRGFTVPEADWLRGAFASEIERSFSGQMLAVDWQLIDRTRVLAAWQRYRRGQGSSGYKDILNAWCLEMWLRAFERHLAPP